MIDIREHGGPFSGGKKEEVVKNQPIIYKYPVSERTYTQDTVMSNPSIVSVSTGYSMVNCGRIFLYSNNSNSLLRILIPSSITDDLYNYRPENNDGGWHTGLGHNDVFIHGEFLYFLLGRMLRVPQTLSLYKCRISDFYDSPGNVDFIEVIRIPCGVSDTDGIHDGRVRYKVEINNRTGILKIYYANSDGYIKLIKLGASMMQVASFRGSGTTLTFTREDTNNSSISISDDGAYILSSGRIYNIATGVFKTPEKSLYNGPTRGIIKGDYAFTYIAAGNYGVPAGFGTFAITNVKKLFSDAPASEVNIMDFKVLGKDLSKTVFMHEVADLNNEVGIWLDNTQYLVINALTKNTKIFHCNYGLYSGNDVFYYRIPGTDSDDKLVRVALESISY